MEKPPAMTTEEVVEEIMRIQRSLPARPGLDEVEACEMLITNVEKEAQSRIEAISRQIKGKDVSDELSNIFQQMQRGVVYYQSNEKKREALKMLDLENVHSMFDDMVQRAAKCVSPESSSSHFVSGTGSSSSTNYSRDPEASLFASAFSSGTSLNSGVTTVIKTTTPGVYKEKDTVNKPSEFVIKDDSFLKKSRSFRSDGIGVSSLSGQDGEKLSFTKFAILIEVSSKKGTKELNLQATLSDQVETLPESLGKLSSLVMLDLSENRIKALPETIGGLSTLQKLYINSNRIIELPETIGDLLNLVYLNVSANQLRTLPSTLARLVCLEELNLSSNSLSVLPDTIGSLVNLKILNVETNEIVEIPHSIGQCSSLKELRADYNRLKALPEAVGRMGSLEVISVRYNNIRQLPTTMASMLNLKELNISFNELEAVPENLCFATALVKLNVSHNFADLESLPRSIGNLDMLEELDISNNQIRVLPDSFGMLEKLRVLNLEGNPLQVPPRDVVEMGAEAVVQYMADLVAKRENTAQPAKQKSWSQRFFSRSNKRKRGGSDSIKT